MKLIRNRTFKKLSALSLSFLLLSNLLLTSAQAFTSSDKGDGTFTNPVIYSDVPDVSVIRVGDTFYMTSTTMHLSPGCPVMKSKDLVNWEIVNYVYDVLDANSAALNLENGQSAYGKGSWASSLKYHEGTFYVAFSSSTTGKTYIYQTEDIENGPWRKSEISGVYHDMSLLFDDDNRVYMIYCSGGTIKIVELTEDATAIKSGGMNKTIIQNANVSANNIVPAEGAHAYKINGKYYIFLISWPNGMRRIELCYRSDRIDGTYEGVDRGSTKGILFNDDLGFNGAGVAQGGIFDTEDGDWYAMLFQDRASVGRVPVLLPLTWDEEGWPIIGVDGKAPKSMNIPIEGMDVKHIVKSDEFEYENDDDLALEWQWNHNPVNDLWSLTERPGYMRLTTVNKSANITRARNTLTQRTFGPISSANVAIEVSGMKNGDYAGLSAFQQNYGFVGVKMVNDTKSIVMVSAPTGGKPNEVASVPLTGDRAYFKVECDFTNNTDKANFFYSLDGETWQRIGNTLQMSYTLPEHFMGYRFALFNFATETTGGYVDFDYYRLDNKTSKILNASMQDASIQGYANAELEVPVTMDALPSGTYGNITASFTIPEYMDVTNVAFNTANITGDCAYDYSNKKLTLSVTGSSVNYTNKSTKVFATIKLKLNATVPKTSTAVLKTDYIKVPESNIVYDVQKAVSNITLSVADKASLAAAIEKAKAIDVSQYTQASVKAMQDALNNANKVLTDLNTLQADVDLATNALSNAITGLQALPPASTPSPDPSPSPAPSGISADAVSLSKNTLTLNVKKSASLIAVVSPANATNKNVTWRSSNQTVASVNQNGTVTAKKPGKATITVTTEDGNKTAACTVTVKKPTIRISHASLKLKVKQSSKAVKIKSSKPSGEKIKSAKSNQRNIATASVKKGKLNIKAKKAGKAVITITSTNGGSAKVKVTVRKR